MLEGKFVAYASQDEADAAVPAAPAVSADSVQVLDLQSQLDEVTRERDELKGQVGTLTTERDQAAQDVSVLRAARDYLQTGLDTKRAEWDEERAQLQADFDSKTAKWETLKAALRQETAVALERVTELEGQFQASQEQGNPDSPDTRTNAELRTALDAKGVSYPSGANKAALQALAAEHGA